MAQRLSEEALAEVLPSLPGWAVEGGALVRTFIFTDFASAIRFVSQVADDAEQQQHHPDIDVRYNRVRLALVSHDMGGLTSKDLKAAKKADANARQLLGPAS